MLLRMTAGALVLPSSLQVSTADAQNDRLILNCELISPYGGLTSAVPWMGGASVMLEQVRNDSRLAPSSLLLGKDRERSLLSLNRKVVHLALWILNYSRLRGRLGWTTGERTDRSPADCWICSAALTKAMTLATPGATAALTEEKTGTSELPAGYS